ncbi:MAG: fatty acid desaturase [Oligoflexus sp.]
MSYYVLCAVVFLLAYLLNITYITIFYHRGLTHSALTLPPRVKSFVVKTGGWVTGLDPKGWCCMHRLHHRYSDTEMDPHSPVHKGFFRIALAQLHSYKRVLKGLIRREKAYMNIVQDFDFDVSWTNRQGLWYLPYVLHLSIALVILLLSGGSAWLLAAAYFLGIMSHPVQGWMVNSMGHALGYRNYATSDNSRNNTMVAWLVAGEGFQNNHHRYPQAVKFSMKWFEVDWGYSLALVMRQFGIVDFEEQKDKEALASPEPWEMADSRA